MQTTMLYKMEILVNALIEYICFLLYNSKIFNKKLDITDLKHKYSIFKYIF